VIHHSATSNGSAAKFDRDHRAKGWDELGYHFVIGNGNGSGNGQVEVGSRWPRQKWGAHAKTPDNRFNEYGIGICLVGNFDVSRPTPQQQQSLARLVAYLMQTYNIPADRVIGHRDAKSTACPGRNFSIPWLRREALALMGAESRPLRTAAIGELMR
jgi:N-acetyl-anhydromuramyl-L-alanine amidase AmpD